MTRTLAALGAGAVLLLGAALAASDPAPAPALRLLETAHGLGQPVQVVEAPDGRLLVVGQEGTVRPLLERPSQGLHHAGAGGHPLCEAQKGDAR